MKMLYIPYWEVSAVIEVDTNGNKPDSAGFINCKNYGYLGAHSIFPLEAKAEILDILFKREKLKEELDDSIKLVYQLNNKYSGKKGF